MRSNKSYVKETLAFVNKLRKQAGADPLDDLRSGKQYGLSCPVSKSLVDAYELPYTTKGDYIFVGPLESVIYLTTEMKSGDMKSGRRKIRQTRAVRRFVRAFDTGRLPEYHI